MRWFLTIFFAALLLGPQSDARAGDWGFRSETAFESFNQGLESLEKGLLDLARTQFESSAKQDKKSDLPVFGLALVLLHENQPAEADAIFQRLAKSHQDASLTVSMVKASLALEDQVEAMARVKRGILLFPNNPDPMQFYIVLSLQAGDFQGPIDAIEKAKHVDSDPVWSCLEVMILAEQRALEPATAAMKRCQSTEQTAYRKAAQNRMDLFAPEQARSMWSKSQEDKDPLERLFQEIREMIMTGNLEGALSHLNGMVVRYPNNPYVLYLRSDVHHRRGEAVKANQDRERLFAADESVEIWSRGEVVGILTPETLQVQRQNIASAAILHVLFNTEAGGLEQGTKALEIAEKWLGDSPSIQAAKASLVFQGGDRAQAWEQIEGLLEQPWTFLSQRAMVLLLETLVTQDTTGVPESVFRWLASQGAWYVRYNRASDWYNAKKYVECYADLNQVRLDDPVAMKQVNELTYACVIAAEDIAGANVQLKAMGGVGQASASRVFQHGWLLVRKNRSEDVETLLADLSVADLSPTEKKERHKLVLYALVETGQIDAALVLSKGEAPRTEYNLAVLLYNGDRYVEASTVLARACPNAEVDFQATCRDLLNIVQEAQ